MDSSRVLVTGGTGFLASWLIKELLENEFRVRTTVRALDKEQTFPHLTEFIEEYGEDSLEIVEACLEDSHEKWSAVVRDCDYVCHVASPFPIVIPKDEQELIRPALAGTLTILNACLQENSVRRVVITSSFLTTCSGHKDENSGNHVWNEVDWGNKNKARPFSKSKILAEKAAWNFMKQLPKDSHLELVSILPSFMFGPLLSPYSGTSSRKLLSRFMKNEMPGIPNLYLNMVDVRDVAVAHVKAMLNPEAAGHRFICSGSGLWLKDMAETLHKEYTPKGYIIPRSTISSALLWIVSFWDDEVSTIFPMLGRKQFINNDKIREVLNMEFRDQKETILDMCQSLIDFNLV